MARQRRIEYPGAFYHVMARGDRREPIVTNDADRELFLRTLDEACARTGWRIHAWVLMGNHYHIVLQTPEANLVAGMKWFQNTYTRRFNARHRLWGHVFGGRYKAVLVEAGLDAQADSPYFSVLLDYVHLNPYRAKQVRSREGGGLAGYAWSSLSQAYGVPPSRRPAWMEVEFGLGLRGWRDTSEGRGQYLRYLEDLAGQESRAESGKVLPEGQSLQSTLERGWYWGGEGFRQGLLQRLDAAPGPRSRTYRSHRQAEEHGEARAEALVRQGLSRFGCKEEELALRKGSDPFKVAIATAIKAQTTVSQAWIAQRLAMKSPANVSQQVQRANRGKIVLNKAQREWLDSVKNC
jgi:putative transposase